tara:strand:- start:131 stop:370 length:240 start_codon:yes stop_codon:yes gene_type:complete
MKTFDRVVLVVLALGIWALVLKPSDITAHGEWHSHYQYADESHTHSADCTISGSAEGSISGSTVDVDSWYYTTVECSVD